MGPGAQREVQQGHGSEGKRGKWKRKQSHAGL